MNRQRLTGLVLIGAALVVVMAISALQGRAVPGRAVASPVPPRPQVGDCATAEVTPQFLEQVYSGEVPVLTSQPCDGARAGEVISITEGTSDVRTECFKAASGYVGLTPIDLGSLAVQNSPATEWIPNVRLVAFNFRPSPLQAAAGQRWSACVMVGAGLEGLQPLPFQESPRDAAIRGGTSFDRFSVCADTQMPERLIPCGEPHRYELIAGSLSVGGTEAASLASCRAKITEVTGLIDPSAGGRLQVATISYTVDQKTEKLVETTYAAAQQGGASLSCVVTPASADEVLTGSLYGLNDRPLPIR